jgi:hypothetical protein
MRCALVLAALAASGCASMRSVRAVALLGDELGRYEHALDDATSYCRLLEAAGTRPSLPCATVEADQKSWSAVPARLAAYARALRDMADDGAHEGLSDDLSRATAGLGRLAWRGLSSDQSAGIGHALDGLVRAITTVHRRRVLTRAMRDSAPHVRTLVAFVRADLRLQLDNLATLDLVADGTAASLIEIGPGATAGRLAAEQLRLWTRGQAAALRRYDRALEVFAAAHDQLAASADHLIARDPEIYHAIVDRVGTIYEGGQQAAGRGASE